MCKMAPKLSAKCKAVMCLIEKIHAINKLPSDMSYTVLLAMSSMLANDIH